jgi:hypothetical protein
VCVRESPPSLPQVLACHAQRHCACLKPLSLSFEHPSQVFGSPSSVEGMISVSGTLGRRNSRLAESQQRSLQRHDLRLQHLRLQPLRLQPLRLQPLCLQPLCLHHMRLQPLRLQHLRLPPYTPAESTPATSTPAASTPAASTPAASTPASICACSLYACSIYACTIYACSIYDCSIYDCSIYAGLLTPAHLRRPPYACTSTPAHTCACTIADRSALQSRTPQAAYGPSAAAQPWWQPMHPVPPRTASQLPSHHRR